MRILYYLKINHFFLKFGTPFDEVEEKLKSIGISFFDIEEVEKGDDSAIDNLINSIDEEDDDNFDDDNFLRYDKRSISLCKTNM